MPLYTIQECAIASGEPLGEILATQKRKSEDRFHVGDRLVVATKPNEPLKIAFSIPSNNPAGENVTYVVEYMSDLEKTAGGSIIGFMSNYLRNKKTRFW